MRPLRNLSAVIKGFGSSATSQTRNIFRLREEQRCRTSLVAATRTPFLCLLILALQLTVTTMVYGQAWTPPKGEGSISTTYQKTDVRYHYNHIGVKTDSGHIHTHTTITTAEYGLTDRLAFDFDLVYVASKYVGIHPHGPLDTGSFHPQFQDAHLGLRYNAIRRTIMVTPFFSFTIPTHDYEVRGHSAVGRGFHELIVGANVGRSLDPLLRNAYVQARYAYAILKRFEGLNLNRSNVDVEVGWSANKYLTLRFITNWQRTHGGFNFPGDIHGPDEFDIHDRVARARFLQFGGGVTVSLNRYFDIHAAYAATPIYARNTHGDKGFVLGISWKFSKGSSRVRIASNSPSSNPAALGTFAF